MTDTNIPDNSTDIATNPFKIRLTKAHRLIARMLEAAPKPDEFGYTRPDNRPQVNIRVSKEQRRNALAIMDRFFKALEARDFEIEIVAEYHQGGTYAVQNRNDRAALWISEKYKKVEHVPTAKELKEKEEYSFNRIPKWDDVPTGQLTLQPGGVIDLSGEEAVNALIEKAVADVEREIASARQKREAEQARRRQEYEKQQAEQQEKTREEAFAKAAKALHEYKLMMEYIEEVRRFGQIPDDQRREGQTLQEWLQWAEWQARSIHPLG